MGEAGEVLFDRKRAESSLCYIGRVLGDVMDCYLEVCGIKTNLENAYSIGERDRLNEAYESKRGQLADFVDELNMAGVILIDFEKGIVHFPTIYTRKRGIFWRWQPGSERVQVYVEPDWERRHPIMPLGKKLPE